MQSGEPLAKRVQSDPSLKFGQFSTDTNMQANAEAQHFLAASAHLKSVGFRKCGWIAIGRAIVHHNFSVSGNCHIADLDIPRGGFKQTQQWRIKAQALVDGVVNVDLAATKFIPQVVGGE